MENIPKRIYLQIGDLTDEEKKGLDFNELSDVCWSSEKIFSSDIEFIRKPDEKRKSIERIAKEANGRSRACVRCRYLMRCTPDISEICCKAFQEGFKKGFNEYKNRLK